MKRIGETSGGSVLVEMNKADWQFMARLAEVCGRQTDAVSDGTAVQTAPAVAPAKPSPPPARAPRQEKAAPAAPATENLCLICGKPLTGLAPTAKTHKGACLKEYTRRQSREWYAKKKAKSAPPAASAAPRTPPKLNPADRLKMIKEADQRVKDEQGIV